MTSTFLLLWFLTILACAATVATIGWTLDRVSLIYRRVRSWWRRRHFKGATSHYADPGTRHREADRRVVGMADRRHVDAGAAFLGGVSFVGRLTSVSTDPTGRSSEGAGHVATRTGCVSTFPIAANWRRDDRAEYERSATLAAGVGATARVTEQWMARRKKPVTLCAVNWCAAYAEVAGGMCAVHREHPKHKAGAVSNGAIAAVWAKVKTRPEKKSAESQSEE